MLNATAGKLPILSKEVDEACFGQGESTTKALYEANCHCGAIRFKFSMTDLKHVPVNHCNCSICTKNGYLMVYPKRDEIEWIRGYDTLSSYRCSTKTMEHKFCPTCGSSVLCDFHWTEETQPNVGDIVAINVSSWFVLQ